MAIVPFNGTPDNETYDGSGLTSADQLVADGMGGNDSIVGGAGDDTIEGGTGNDTVRGGGGDDVLIADAGNDVMDGGTGSDTFDASTHSTLGVFVNLATGVAFGGTETGSDQLISIENVRGGSGQDDLRGDANNNIFYATAGNDLIDGGEPASGDDSDTFDASNTTSGVTVNLSMGGVNATGTEIGNTQLANIENAIGGSGGDVLTGNGDTNILTGNGGDDSFAGLGAGDVVHGGAGDDAASFTANREDATIAFSGSDYTVTIGSSVVTLDGVGVLHFTDGDIRVVSGTSGVSDYQTIQSAVEEAVDTDWVVVAAGTYREQVTITSDIRLIGAGQNATIIEAPDALVANVVVPTSGTPNKNAIVGVIDSAVEISDIGIDGRTNGNNVSTAGGAADFDGIYLYNSSGLVDSVHVTGVRDPDPSPGVVSGVQRGNAIYTFNTDGVARDVTVQNSTVDGFQKNGITFNGAGLDGTAQNNTVTGGGDQPIIAQNGIQIGFGATGTIDHNTITDLSYTGPSDTGASGILIYQANDVVITDNTVDLNGADNDAAIAISESNNPTATGNMVSDAGYGIYQAGTFTDELNHSDNDFNNTTIGLGFYPSNGAVAYSFTGEAGNDEIVGNDQNDTLAGAAGDDSLYGEGGDDILSGDGGSDSIDGGAGSDVAQGYAAGSTLAIVGDQWTVTSGTDVDTLSNVEQVVIDGTTYLLVDKFSDGGYDSVQAAIDAAPASGGATILIAPGTYSESAVPTEASATAGGLYIYKPDLVLQGVAADGTAITDAETARTDGATIVSAQETDFGSNHFVGRAGDNTLIRGLHLQAGDETSNKLLEIWADNVTVQSNFVDVYNNGTDYTYAAAIYFNDNGTETSDEITQYLVDGNILNEGVIVSNGVGDPTAGIAPDQQIVNNKFEGTFDENTGEGRYDTVVINGNIPGVAYLAESSQIPTIENNDLGDGTTPFILRGSDATEANLPTAVQVAQILADNTDGDDRFAYVLEPDGDLEYADRNDGAGPYHSFAVTNTIDTLNLALDSTPDAVFGSVPRNYIQAGDTIVVQSGDTGTVDSQIMVEDLTVRANEHSADLDLTLATEFADGTAISNGGVHNLTLADYAAGQGADVDVTGNALDNTITGNSGDNSLSGEGGNDTLSGGAGDDDLHGGAGSGDVATYAGNAADFTVTSVGGTVTVTDNDASAAGDEGTDTLVGVELIRFADSFYVADGMSIQAAINAAEPGDTIYVGTGTYHENITVDRSLTIVGVGNAVLEGSFKTDNSVPGTVADFLKTAPSYSSAAGAGITIAADDVTVSNLAVSSYLTGIELGDGIDRTQITDVAISDSVNGIRKGTQADVNDLTISGGSITDGYIGIYFAKTATAGQATDGLIDTVLIDGTAFQNLTEKGIYAEALSNAVITNFTMTEVGEFGRGPSFGASQVGAFGAGIDINLKNGSYTGIEISNFTMTDVGSSDQDGTAASHPGGGAIEVKARNDAPSYDGAPATYTGTVDIHDGSIAGTSTGVRAGEPGKNITGPAVDVTNVDITGEVHDANHGDVANVTQSPMTVTLTGDADTLDASPTSTGTLIIEAGAGDDTVAAGNGADTVHGDAGNDTIDGRGGIDTATYSGAQSAYTVTDNGAGAFTVSGPDGTDTVKGVEQLTFDTGEPTVLLVGNGGYATIQDAIDAASEGDTIVLAADTYSGTVTINKGVTLLGANAGTDGAAARGGESIITGAVTINSTTQVVIDGIEFLDATPFTSSQSDARAALTVLTSAAHEIRNSVFLRAPAEGIHSSTFVSLSAAQSHRGIEIAAVTGSVLIEDNLFTNANPYPYGGDTWRGAVYSNGGTGTTTISSNSFESNRTGINADNFSATVTIDGNDFTGDGTGVALFTTVPTTITSITDNSFANVDTDFNLRNISAPVTFDIGGSGNTATENRTGRLDEMLVDGSATAADNLIGTAGRDALFGNGGNDTLVGGAGNDTLDGGAGADSMSGGANDDTYVVDDAGDQTIENAGEGTDTVQSGISLTLADNVENLTLTGTGPLNGTGNSSGNTINGNSGNNVLTGLGGNDVVNGNAGNDTVVYAIGDGNDTVDGGADSDQLTVNGSAGPDTIVVTAGTGSFTVETTADGNPEITASHIEDILVNGGDSADTITFSGDFAAAGVDSTTVTLNGGGDNDTIDVSGATGTTFVLNGEAGDDTLIGSSGSDTLNGGEGDDQLTGNGGNDTVQFTGNLGDYTVTYDAATDTYTVTDNVGTDGTDTATGVENLQFADTTVNAGGSVKLLDENDNFVQSYATIQEAIDAAGTDYTILVGDGTYAESLTLSKALTIKATDGAMPVVDPASGNGLTISGTIGSGATVSIEGIAFQGATNAGIQVLDGTVLGTLSLDGVTSSQNLNFGLIVGNGGDAPTPVGGMGSPATAVDNVVITGSTFENNGTSGQQVGNVYLWRYDGNATLTDVSLIGAPTGTAVAGRPDYGLLVQGNDNRHLGNGDWALGDVTLTNVTVDGEYHKNAVAVYTFTNIDGLDIDGLHATDFVSNWGPVLNIDGITSSYDASGYDIDVPAGPGPWTELQGDNNTDGTPGQAITDNAIVGTDQNDRLIGKEGNDTLTGGAGDDQLFGGTKGDPTPVDQGARDVAVYAGPPGEYTLNLTVNGSGAVSGTITDNNPTGLDEGTDTLSGIEVLRFGTTLVVLDGMSIQAAVDAANPGDTISVAAGAYSGNVTISKAITIQGAGAGQSIVTGGATGFTITGDIDNGGSATVSISGFSFNGNSEGIRVSSTTQLHQLTVDGAAFNGNITYGIGTGSGAAGLDAVSILNSTFGAASANGTGGFNGGGDIILFGYTGDATISNVQIAGVALPGTATAGKGDNAIQITGFNPSTYDVTSPIGAVSLSNVTVTGNYHKPQLAIQGYNDLTGLSVANVSLSGTAEWGYLVFIDPVADSNPTAPAGVNGKPGHYTPGDGASVLNLTGLTVDNQSVAAGFAGAGATDVFVRGTDANDTMTGTAADDVLNAVSDQGIDFGGNDSLSGANGNDTLFGGIGVDTLRGGNGDDVLDGGAGPDVLDGGANKDTASYGSATSSVTIDLTNSANNNGDAQGDTYTSIEAFSLSSFGDNFTGNSSANEVNGGNGSDILRGGGGNDTLRGEGDGDVLLGEDGNDSLEGGAGNDALFGGNDNDTLIGGAGADNLDGGAGTDVVSYAGSTQAVTINLNNAAANTGDAQGDSFTAIEAFELTNQNDTFVGAGDADKVSGLAGSDTLSGNGGNDTLIGGAGADSMSGGAGDDVFVVTAAEFTGDTIDGGTDTVFGDILDVNGGGTFNMNLGTVTAVERVVLRTATTFTANNIAGLRVDGSSSADNITLGSGGQLANAGGGNDTVTGGSGADRIDGGTGADMMAGGGGDDTYIVDNVGDVVTEAAGGGSDTVYATANYTLTAGSEIEYLRAFAGNTGLALGGNELSNYIVGGGGADTVTGGGGNDTVYGGNGNDQITTGDGSDYLDGQAGADTMAGGSGDDTYVVDNAGDVVTEAAGGGYDRVFAKSDYTLQAGSEVEQLRAYAGNTGLALTGNELSNYFLGGDGADTLTGGGGNDTVYGGNGNDQITTGGGSDYLDGQAGADTMAGGDGDDTYIVDNAGDVVTEAMGDGYDRVFARADYTLQAGTEVEYLRAYLGNSPLALTGNEQSNYILGAGGADTLTGGGGNDTVLGGGGNDQITTGSGADVIDGGAGADTMTGGGGDDRYSVDNANDVVTEAVGGGFDRVFATANYTLGAGSEVEQLQSASAAGLALTGNEFDNRLFGGVGGDTLRGGAGADFLVGGNGADVFVFAQGDGGATLAQADRISDFVDGTDHIGLAGGLTFGDLTISQDTNIGYGPANDAVVSVTATGEILFFATNVSTLDASDFILFP